MKGIRLLLKNAFKSAGRNKSQIVGLSLLVMLVSLIISLISATTNRVVKAYTELVSVSNLRDYVTDVEASVMIQSPQKNDLDFINYEVVDGKGKELKLSIDQVLYQNYIMNQLALNGNLQATRTEGRIISSVKNGLNDLAIKTIVKTPITPEDGVDKMIVSKGRDAKNVNEVVMGESFARANNIKVGDIIRLNKDTYGDQILVKKWNAKIASEIKNRHIDEILEGIYSGMSWFEVVGFGSSADFVSPLIDRTSIMPNVNKEAIIYLHPSAFGFESATYTFRNKNDKTEKKRFMYTYNQRNSKIVVTSDADREQYISFKSKNSPSKIELKEINKRYNTLAGIERDVNYTYLNGDTKYKYAARVLTFNIVMNGYQTLSTFLLVVIIFISGFTIVLTTKKQVSQQSRQMGCLKALGYKKSEVVNNFIAVPLIVSVIGFFVGYILSILIGILVVNTFANYFNIAFYELKFDIISFGTNIILTWLFLTVLTFSIGYLTIKLPALTLLRGGDDKVISKLSIKIKSLTKNASFNTRLRTALLTTSLGKLVGVNITMLLSAILMSVTIIAPKVMKDNYSATFNGMEYENLVEYTQPVANNPYSFYRTYNPLNNDDENWKYNVKNNPIKVIGSGYKEKTGWTAYPLKENDNKEKVIDWNKVVEQLSNGTAPSAFYTYDIVQEDVNYWAELAFLDWKNLSTDFLLNLDVANSSEPLASVGLLVLQEQWPDFAKLKKDWNNLPKIPDGGEEENKKNLINFTKSLLWFYNKYIRGLKLTFKKLPNDNNEFVIGKNDKGYTGAYKDLDPLLTEELSNYWINYADNKDNKGIEDLSKIVVPLIGSDTADIELNINGFNKNPSDISDNKLNATNVKADDLKKLNTALITWFNNIFEGRIGVAILQTAYTRAPYFVQELMKEAISRGQNYNLGFNLVPYNNKTDEVGNMINGEFKSTSNKKESFKIFGIDKDTKLVDLKDKKGNLLIQKLFEKNSNNEIPIIVNESFYKKSRQGFGSVISPNLFIESLTNKNGDDVETKFGHYGSKGLKTEGLMTYYSKSDNGFHNTPFVGSGNGLNPATINEKWITARDALTSITQTDVHKAYSDGDLIIDTRIIQDKKFKIVGVQDGYGQSQAWISNDNAKEILGYDKSQEMIFESFFAKEYPSSDDFYNLDIIKQNKEFQELEEVKKFFHIDNKHEPKYNDFKEKLNNSKKDSVWERVNTLFENMYPIFNYKYTSDSNIYELTQTLSTSQRIADFSSQGLNGNYSYKKADPNCKPSETNTCDMIPDPEDYVEGFGLGTVSTMLPIEQTRQILGQVNALVNMIIIMFFVIALIISSTIILLTTSLIIHENKQFIAAMKTLGYSNLYVVKQVLGMYIGPIFVMFFVGFGLGWWIFNIISDILALITAFVLPVYFSIYLPFVVFGVIALIYIGTFSIGWTQIQKINPLELLKSKD